jgi:ferrochelatase
MARLEDIRTAVILMNLGGPDRVNAVRPFLFNLFNDRAIIGAPQPLRWILAQALSRRRAPTARAIYAHLGGGSPLLANTEAQAGALEGALADLGEVRVFIAMRHWNPRSDEAASAVAAFAPDRIVALPLYPQYSSTTTGSSLADWRRAAAGLAVPTQAICCYPTQPGFIAALAEATRAALGRLEDGGRYRVLFSAHGLPKRVVQRGDPYQRQVEETAAAVAAALRLAGEDWAVCYQSRVGPLEWIGPATDAQIRHAASEGRAVVVVPIAFVSEHSETLVELDIEYRRIAEEAGAPAYVRAPTPGTMPVFIEGLANLVRGAIAQEGGIVSDIGARRCAAGRQCCPMPAGES